MLWRMKAGSKDTLSGMVRQLKIARIMMKISQRDLKGLFMPITQSHLIPFLSLLDYLATFITFWPIFYSNSLTFIWEISSFSLSSPNFLVYLIHLLTLHLILHWSSTLVYEVQVLLFIHLHMVLIKQQCCCIRCLLDLKHMFVMFLLLFFLVLVFLDFVLL